MRPLKGSIDLVTLIVGTVAITLLLVLSSIYMDSEVNSELYAETVYHEGRYQSLVSTAQLLRPEVTEDVSRYPVASPYERQEIEEELSENVSRVLGYQSQNYRFSIKDRIELEGNAEGQRVRSEIYVASPSEEKVIVQVGLGDGR